MTPEQERRLAEIDARIDGLNARDITQHALGDISWLLFALREAHIDLERIRAGARQWLRQDNPVAHLRNCAVTPRAKRLDDAARTACRIGLGQACTCGLAAFCASLEDKEGNEG